MKTRRDILKGGVSCAVVISTDAFGAFSLPEIGLEGTNNDAEQWLNKWMMTPNAASGTLHLGRFADRIYYLLKDIGWEPKNISEKIKVPKGFVTDFASVPRAFWSILPPDGLYTYPAILHDYLYWEQITSRSDADLIFKDAMNYFDINKVKVNTIYQAVSLAGGGAWDRNKKMKDAGEKRILKKFPTDPTVRWGQWKSDPSVF